MAIALWALLLLFSASGLGARVVEEETVDGWSGPAGDNVWVVKDHGKEFSFRGDNHAAVDFVKGAGNSMRPKGRHDNPSDIFGRFSPPWDTQKWPVESPSYEYAVSGKTLTVTRKAKVQEPERQRLVRVAKEQVEKLTNAIGEFTKRLEELEQTYRSKSGPERESGKNKYDSEVKYQKRRIAETTEELGKAKHMLDESDLPPAVTREDVQFKAFKA